MVPRPLHYVFKIGNRSASMKFFQDVLGMTVFRHEEFSEGCKATCNGPYDGKWSKTMIGYGTEDDNFVLELTYNYGISSYRHGNDLVGLTIESNKLYTKLKVLEEYLKYVDDDASIINLTSPCGYKYFIKPNLDGIEKETPIISQVSISCSDLKKSVEFWSSCLGMSIRSKTATTATLFYSPQGLEIILNEAPKVDRGSAFGRIAFSRPRSELSWIENRVKENNYTILNSLVSLDTPGKTTVQVVILADPDGHEICFVEDEGFRKLSELDPNSLNFLNSEMEADKSDEWFSKHGKEKSSK